MAEQRSINCFHYTIYLSLLYYIQNVYDRAENDKLLLEYNLSKFVLDVN